ncbi:MAG: hypothetical protein PSV24_01155 [Rhodoferax sp.]|nr:hypothetical protein [Rhodoferax sp.]
MDRLQTELHRLYLPLAASSEGQYDPGETVRLIDADGRVRAMVVQLAQHAGWNGMAALWQGVQSDFGLPAPAVAVSGVNGYQLWLSMAEPVPLAQALAFLEALRLRYLAGIDPRHIRMAPQANESAAPTQSIRRVPSVQGESGRWSAFVAPGLAGMFADEPWLDMAPGTDAQAKLLASLKSIQPAEFQQALDQLRPADAPPHRASASVAANTAHDSQDPKRFLLAVMNDPANELHLRIEAAKALLPYFERHPT